MTQFNSGDIVRYGSGSTALAKLATPHAGGWMADQCMGGSTFVSSVLRLADEEDLRMWKKCAWHRGEGIPETWRPKILKEGGRWVVRFSNSVPMRWQNQFLDYVNEAQKFVYRLNEVI